MKNTLTRINSNSEPNEIIFDDAYHADFSSLIFSLNSNKITLNKTAEKVEITTISHLIGTFFLLDRQYQR